MLTLKAITQSKAWSYYKKKNYYSDSEQQENSQWSGKGAKKLGLTGKIVEEEFKNLAFDKSPNGERFRGKTKNKKHKERAGVDCSFTSPKVILARRGQAAEPPLLLEHRFSIQNPVQFMHFAISQTADFRWLLMGKNSFWHYWIGVLGSAKLINSLNKSVNTLTKDINSLSNKDVNGLNVTHTQQADKDVNSKGE